MKKIGWWLFAAMMAACLAFADYCQYQAAQLADLKAGNGNIEQALLWNEYALWLVGAGCFFGFLASYLQPYFKRWEKLAFTICLLSAYGIFATLMGLLI